MKNKKGFTLVELIAVITILTILLGLVTMNVVEFYNKRKVKDYENIKSIIEDNAKVFINTDSDVYSEVDDKLQESGSCKILYDRLVDAKLLAKDMINPMDNSKFYNNNKYIKITIDDADYLYEYMEEDNANVDYCSLIDRVYNLLCIKATSSQLHTNPNGGYFGQVSTGSNPAPGDAYICDVNGDKNYNASTEMFYYLSPQRVYNYTYNNTYHSYVLSPSWSDTYVSLIYYNNTSNGIPNNTSVHNYKSSSNTSPSPIPYTAKANLPSTDQWSKTTDRIPSRLFVSTSDLSSKSIVRAQNSSSPIYITYDSLAATMPNFEELKSACPDMSQTEGSFDNCKFLLENTYYHNTSYASGYWLENPKSSTEGWIVAGTSKVVSGSMGTSSYGVRPVIRVKKTDLE